MLIPGRRRGENKKQAGARVWKGRGVKPVLGERVWKRVTWDKKKLGGQTFSYLKWKKTDA